VGYQHPAVIGACRGQIAHMDVYLAVKVGAVVVMYMMMAGGVEVS